MADSKGEGKSHAKVRGKTDKDAGAVAGDGLALDANQGIKRVDHAGSKVASNGHKAGAGGIARILEPEKNEDEFAKGTVGKPEETEALAEDGNQDGMGEETLLYGGGYFERETAGLEDGVSLRETVNADSIEPNYNYDIDPLTGNAPERKIGRSNNYLVSGKRKNKFLIGEM